jgi:hypothetical protein
MRRSGIAIRSPGPGAVSVWSRRKTYVTSQFVHMTQLHRLPLLDTPNFREAVHNYRIYLGVSKFTMKSSFLGDPRITCLHSPGLI